MKFLRLLPIAAIACLAVSCQNGEGGLSQNSSQTDSLMYYLGQIHAADYMREASRDTTLKEASEKQAYLSGVKAGLAALQEGKDTYNKGVMMGMQMAGQIMSFSEQMGIDINKNAYINSISTALMADSMPNTSEAQKGFREVMASIDAAKQAKDQAASQESLKQVAESNGLPKITDDLYGKVTVSNDSAAIEKGDEITLVAQIAKENGEIINMPLPPKGKVGNTRSFPTVVSDALLTLKSGESGEFLTSAHAMIGQRASQMGLEPSDVIKLTLTPSLVPKAPADDKK